MKRTDHMPAVAKLSESEGVFTTAQAARMGIPRDALLDIGDFYLSPYRIYAPRRINSRNKAASFAVRKVARDEVSFAGGLPVTTPERTIFDLVADDEDLSLVADALRSACAGSRPFDFNKLEALFDGKYGKNKASRILTSLLADAGIAERG